MAPERITSALSSSRVAVSAGDRCGSPARSALHTVVSFELGASARPLTGGAALVAAAGADADDASDAAVIRVGLCAGRARSRLVVATNEADATGDDETGRARCASRVEGDEGAELDIVGACSANGLNASAEGGGVAAAPEDGAEEADESDPN